MTERPHRKYLSNCEMSELAILLGALNDVARHGTILLDPPDIVVCDSDGRGIGTLSRMEDAEGREDWNFRPARSIAR